MAALAGLWGFDEGLTEWRRLSLELEQEQNTRYTQTRYEGLVREVGLSESRADIPAVRSTSDSSEPSAADALRQRQERILEARGFSAKERQVLLDLDATAESKWKILRRWKVEELQLDMEAAQTVPIIFCSITASLAFIVTFLACTLVCGIVPGYSPPRYDMRVFG
jgi:hypothetical protein